MGLFDFLKRKEFDKIDSLTKELELVQKQLADIRNHSDKITHQLTRYQSIIDIENECNKIKNEIDDKRNEIQKNIDTIDSQKVTIQDLNNTIKEKKKEIVELDQNILLQDFGIYSPIYDFANSDIYKDHLTEIRSKQKKMVLDKTAATCSQNWTVNGSEAKGRVMTNQNIKQILRCFNDECDVLVSKVKFNNIEAFKEKIIKSYEALNRMNTSNSVTLSYEYVQLKIEELQLAYEYARKKQDEKEEQKRLREQMREEAKLQKEIEEARKDIDKEIKHYSNALMKLNKQLESCDDTEMELLQEKKVEIEGHLAELDVAIKDIDYREANKRAGYVYVISNIGSFGEDVYKIGMTRRLDPMERVDELGDASVPFKFDVHALIFSDDAPALETALHHAFESKKVNMVNGRREFFHVTLEEVEDVVKANYDKTVEFTKVPEADQYRESLKILAALRKNTNKDKDE